MTQLAPASPAIQRARADSPTPKAVFIVGPTNDLTNSNLVDAEKMAVQAENAGMDVHRVFYPNATWAAVLNVVQDANLVVYMGHGYGWPSPYTAKLTESRQDGMGLNSPDVEPAPNRYTYYGANLIRESIHLAPNAVVILVHGCYTAGNGEPGMAIPAADLARQRVDNFASGFLGAGARAVFAFGWNQKLNFPNALANSNSTMDQIFMTTAGGSPAGFVGWQDHRFDSQRTPGATNHLDPHSNYGFYRAVTGDLGMTAADWRSGAAADPPPPPPPPPPGDPVDPPQITELGAATAQTGVLPAGAATFNPNGDGLEDELMLQHTVSRAAYLDATVTNSAGQVVRSYSLWSTAGTGTSIWDGRDSAGIIVGDGSYTLTYVPRDSSGVIGDGVSTNALVLTAAALATPSKLSIYVSDADKIDNNTTLNVTLNQPAQVTWTIKNLDGLTVRTIKSGAQMSAGLTKFVWDGKSDAGQWVPDGRYRSVVNTQTGLGSYSQERGIYVGAFQFTPPVSPVTRGVKTTLELISTEFLSANPSVRITQPGLAAVTVTAKLVSGHKYKLTFTPKTGAGAGVATYVITGTDSKGHRNTGTLSLPLL